MHRKNITKTLLNQTTPNKNSVILRSLNRKIKSMSMQNTPEEHTRVNSRYKSSKKIPQRSKTLKQIPNSRSNQKSRSQVKKLSLKVNSAKSTPKSKSKYGFSPITSTTGSKNSHKRYKTNDFVVTSKFRGSNMKEYQNRHLSRSTNFENMKLN
jgi:asparagine N-glycosylation enzyme membrane subunit Stt3